MRIGASPSRRALFQTAALPSALDGSVHGRRFGAVGGWPSVAPRRPSGLVGVGQQVGRFAPQAGFVGGRDVLEQLVEQLLVIARFDAGSALAVDRYLHAVNAWNDHADRLARDGQRPVKGPSDGGDHPMSGRSRTYASAAAVPEAGSVRNHAVTMLRATPQRTALRRSDDPTPMIAELMT